MHLVSAQLNLSSSLANILKLIHKVMACKMKAKFNFELYHFIRSGVMPLDLPEIPV
jgi:hypothetical protein